jgi:hypothetical protein
VGISSDGVGSRHYGIFCRNGGPVTQASTATGAHSPSSLLAHRQIDDRARLPAVAREVAPNLNSSQSWGCLIYSVTLGWRTPLCNLASGVPSTSSSVTNAQLCIVILSAAAAFFIPSMLGSKLREYRRHKRTVEGNQQSADAES